MQCSLVRSYSPSLMFCSYVVCYREIQTDPNPQRHVPAILFRLSYPTDHAGCGHCGRHYHATQYIPVFCLSQGELDLSYLSSLCNFTGIFL